MTYPDQPWFPLRTERLLLRAFRETDFDDIHAYATDDEVVRYMDWGPNTLDDTHAAVARFSEAQARWPRPDVNLAVEHVEDGRVIGSIRLGVNDEANQAGDLGYCLNRAYWRRGLATEAARAMIDTGFRVLGLHRIWADCDVRNVGSYSVMQKLGMRREAHFRKNKLVRDGWRDSYLYAVLAEDWPGAETARG